MVTVFAEIVALPESVDTVAQELGKIIPLTRAEPGCIEYKICQGVEKREYFYGYEVFESIEAFQAHTESDHFKGLVQAVGSSLAQEPKVTVTEEL